MDRWRVGILVFDGVAALDLAGPFEVFSRARLEPGVESRQSEASAPFDVFTVGKTKDPVTATGGLVLLPSWSFADAPAAAFQRGRAAEPRGRHRQRLHHPIPDRPFPDQPVAIPD